MRTPLFAVLLTAPLLVAGCDASGPDALDGARHDPDAPADARHAAGFETERHDALTGAVTRGRQERQSICHYDADADAYHPIEVGAPALPAHLRHGDGAPGGGVPGSDGAATFSETCGVVDAQPFTCSTQGGIDSDGRPTLTVTLLVTGSAYLPVSFGATVTTNAQHLGYEWIEAGGVRAGRTSTFRQTSPTAGSTAGIGVGGPNIPGAFICGPYEFGA